ncbi:MAG: universal stress protein [Bacteroidales bacterium]|nr:universal stress protein [Bacteroidales bacterium]
MNQGSNIILVTWDFTEKSEYALSQAIEASKTLQSKIGLLHIVKKETEVPQAEEKLRQEIAGKLSHLKDILEVFVITGNIFSTISEKANEIGAELVFMGTHGIKGMQKLMGSWALKVIAHTKMPFIVVQEPFKKNIFENIVLPVNFRKENKECINWATFFSKNFGSKFHVLTAKHTDPNFVKGIESNKFFIKKYFSSRGIDFEMVEMPGKNEFFKEVITYTTDQKFDSIMVMTTRDIGFADYVLGAQEQYIIANEHQIPVICINPKPPKFGGSFSTAGG